jgi:small-conductance mechanosensitive channel
MGEYAQARLRYLEDLQKIQQEEMKLLQKYKEPSAKAAEETEAPSAKQKTTFWDQVRRGGNLFAAVWDFQILTLSGNPITVGKILLGLAALIVGLFVARFFTKIIRLRGISRLRIDQNAAMALEKVLFYFLVVLVVLFSLQLVNIPLSIFAFLGGAIALAFGFGAQNILNNFISGWILMIERPIKISDLIEVEGQYGSVESIGARCTRIRMFNGIHILVPNSDLLEKNVINWTLSDDKVRVDVAVGVAYGSPTREVERLIRKAVEEHPKIIQSPEPIVLFEEFGDNALLFEVHFWVSVRRLMDARRIRSEIRFQIDDLFREAGITIAFPQRDVHLDSLSPLEVRVLSSEEKQARDKQATEKEQKLGEAEDRARKEREAKPEAEEPQPFEPEKKKEDSENNSGNPQDGNGGNGGGN